MPRITTPFAVEVTRIAGGPASLSLTCLSAAEAETTRARLAEVFSPERYVVSIVASAKPEPRDG